MFKNKKIFKLELGPLNIELYWGWDNGEGMLSIQILDLDSWEGFRAIHLFQLTAWIVSFSVSLDLDFSASAGDVPSGWR